jgi:cell shape-determining protein MreC
MKGIATGNEIRQSVDEVVASLRERASTEQEDVALKVLLAESADMLEEVGMLAAEINRRWLELKARVEQ